MELTQKIAFTGRLFVRVRAASQLGDDHAWGLISQAIEALMLERDQMIDPAISRLRNGPQVQMALDHFSAEEIESAVELELGRGDYLAQQPLRLDTPAAPTVAAAARSAAPAAAPAPPTANPGAARRQFDRGEHFVVPGQELGEMFIDDHVATELEYSRDLDERGAPLYDLRFYNGGLLMGELEKLTHDQMIDAAGERNAATIAAGDGTGRLIDNQLHNEYGLSPAQVERRIADAGLAHGRRPEAAVPPEPSPVAASPGAVQSSEHQEPPAGLSAFAGQGMTYDEQPVTRIDFERTAAGWNVRLFDGDILVGDTTATAEELVSRMGEANASRIQAHEGALGTLVGDQLAPGCGLSALEEMRRRETATEIPEESADSAKLRLLKALSGKDAELQNILEGTPESAQEARTVLEEAREKIAKLAAAVEKNAAQQQIDEAFQALKASGVPFDALQEGIDALGKAQEPPTQETPEADAIRPAKATSRRGAKSKADRKSAQGADKDEQEFDALRQVAGEDGAEPPASTAPTSLLNGAFVRDDKGNYRRKDEEKISLVDEGVQIQIIDKQMDTFQASIELAASKGWTAVEVTGSPKFRSEAWLHASLAGLEIVGFEPAETDLARLEEARTKLDGKAPEAAIERSRNAAIAVAKMKVGKEPKEADLEKGWYPGPIIHRGEHHAIQALGRGESVIHDLSRLDRVGFAKVPEGGSAIVEYQGGRGLVRPKAKDKDKSLTH